MSDILIFLSNEEKCLKFKNVDSIIKTFKAIHTIYYVISIHGSKEASNEALKRALFIQWYYYSEPNRFTNINELDEDIMNQVLNRVSDKIEVNDLDKELETMLKFYFSITEWVFDKYPILVQFGKKYLGIPISKSDLELINLNSFQNRGLMGEYWNSLDIPNF